MPTTTKATTTTTTTTKATTTITTTASTTSTQQSTTTPQQTETVSLGDPTNDGKIDVIHGNWSDRIQRNGNIKMSEIDCFVRPIKQ